MTENDSSIGGNVVIVKIGSDVLVQKDNSLDVEVIQNRILEIAQLIWNGCKVAVVTSGAKAKGMKALGLSSIAKGDEVLTQVACSVGQSRVINAYDEALKKAHELLGKELVFPSVSGQLLLTRNELDTPEAALSIRRSIERMWALGSVLPVINANDPVSAEELKNKIGDNDTLAAKIARLLQAKIAVFLSSDGLLADVKDPASIVRRINPLKENLRHLIVNDAKSNNGTGGMDSKYDVCEGLALDGIEVPLGNGKAENAIIRLIRGEIGTLFSIRED